MSPNKHRSGEKVAYEVYARWTAHSNRASDATYSIHHLDGSTEITVNQQENGGQWDLLGTYSLDTSSTINLSSAANGYVIADAIRLTSVASTLTEAIYYFHNDHLGTPQKMTDQNQAVVWAASYNPFGKASVSTETVSNNIRFPGQYFDEESGLHYNYFRDYDPSMGRYLQSDPIGLSGGLNTYAYTENNPLSFIDPLGLRPTKNPKGPDGRPRPSMGCRTTCITNYAGMGLLAAGAGMGFSAVFGTGWVAGSAGYVGSGINAGFSNYGLAQCLDNCNNKEEDECK